MITSKKQYKITRKKADGFVRALEEFDATSAKRTDVPLRLLQSEREAMASQLEDLQREIDEYKSLQSGHFTVISGTSFDELADGLIMARIAAGLSQRALARRLGLKEQQIRRYESERYATASYRRLCQISHALGVRIANDILLPMVPADFDTLLTKVEQVGLNREFVVQRLLSSADVAIVNGEVAAKHDREALTERAAAALEHVFGWDRDSIFGAPALPMPSVPLASARFKLPKGRTEGPAALFAAYAHHLATTAILSMDGHPSEAIPVDPAVMRQLVLTRGNGADDLLATLHTAWDLGVIVLPLRATGTFHGACWRYGGRNAIVLKQTSEHQSRWIFDLLHELYHAGQCPEDETFALVESKATSRDRRESREEVAASQFAGDVMLAGKAEMLAELCVREAAHSVERLKSAVPRIAQMHGVSTAALANYLAFKLSQQGINWWGAAANLQDTDSDPWRVTRDVFLDRHPLQIESEVDRVLLDRALS